MKPLFVLSLLHLTLTACQNDEKNTASLPVPQPSSSTAQAWIKASEARHEEYKKTAAQLQEMNKLRMKQSEDEAKTAPPPLEQKQK